MAFFKLRKGGDEMAATPRQPESIEAMRKRARHRLIGAAVLVLIGVVGFPLLFDTQPRPVSVDIPIEIPDRNKVKPLPAPVAAAPVPAPAAPASAASVPAPPVQAAAASAPPAALPAAPASAVAKAEPKPETRPAPPVETPVAAKVPDPKPAAPQPDDGARALALLEGKNVAASQPAAGEARYIVQVGAFADAAKARETRLKVERAGMKTYTHVAETKDGKLTRVRVGPFATEAEAERAAQKIKALELDPRVQKL